MWPSVAYETCAWETDYDELAFIPKSRRRKILPTYEAALPAKIAQLTVNLSPEIQRRIRSCRNALRRSPECARLEPSSPPFKKRVFIELPD